MTSVWEKFEAALKGKGKTIADVHGLTADEDIKSLIKACGIEDILEVAEVLTSYKKRQAPPLTLTEIHVNERVKVENTNVPIGSSVPITPAGSFVNFSHLIDAGVGSKTNRFYVRKEWEKLWNELNALHSQGKNVLLEGPPGTGKSSLVWGWCLYYASKGHRVRWVHLQDSGAARLIDFKNGFLNSFIVYDRENIDALFPPDDVKLLIFDGAMRSTRRAFDIACMAWYIASPKTRQFIGVSSLQFTIKGEILIEYNMQRLHSTGWTLEEYKKACEDNIFYSSIENQLVASITTTKTKEEKLESKYFLAGHCARWMFFFDHLSVIEDIKIYLSKANNLSDLIQGISGDRSLVTINHIFSTLDGTSSCLVSEYVARELARKVDIAFIKQATILCRQFGNPGLDGWIFQMDVLSRMKKSEKITFHNTKEVWNVNTVYFHYDLYDTAFIHNIQLFVNEDWFIPQKINQGCYDAVQFFPSSKLIRVIQITRGAKHDFKLQYITDLIELLKLHGRPISKLDLVVIIPARSVFSLGTVSDAKSLKDQLAWSTKDIRVLEFLRADEI